MGGPVRLSISWHRSSPGQLSIQGWRPLISDMIVVNLLQVYNWTTQQLLMSRSLVNNNETVVWCLKEIPSVVCRQSLAGRAGVDSQTARFGVSMSLLFL